MLAERLLNVMGPKTGGVSNGWAAAFTPRGDHTITRIEVAVGYSQEERMALSEI